MDLPDECWELIFNRLPRHHLLDCISLVSKRFLSISSCLIRTLTISDPNLFLSHGNLSKLFGTRFKQIKRIHITDHWPSEEYDLTLIVVEIARSGLDLEQLSITRFEKITSSALEELGSNMSNLKSLALNYYGLSDCILIAISKFLPWLHELDISYPDFDHRDSNWRRFTHTSHVTDEGIGALASNLKQLRKINLSRHDLGRLHRSLLALFLNCSFLNEFEPYLQGEVAVFALRNCSSLNSLSIAESRSKKFTVENSISYARSLHAITVVCHSDTLLCSLAKARLPLLKKFKLYSSWDITFTGISTLLHQYQSLSELDLSYATSLTDDHMNHLSKYLCNLTRINLSRCEELTNSTFFIIARGCPLLVEFVMKNTRLGRSGDLLPTDFRKNSRIQFLGLSCNDCLNDETLAKIASICPSLVMLDISSSCCYVTKKGISEILKNCPAIKHLKVNGVFCENNMIFETDTEISKLNIEVLETSMGDKGITTIGMRCPALLKLSLFCNGVTADGVKEVVRKCTKLRVINLRKCKKIDVNVLYWMMSSSLSLRKIIVPNGSRVTVEDRIFFMRRGCHLSVMETEKTFTRWQ